MTRALAAALALAACSSAAPTDEPRPVGAPVPAPAPPRPPLPPPPLTAKSPPDDCDSAAAVIESEAAGAAPRLDDLRIAWARYGRPWGVSCPTADRWRVVAAAIASLDDLRLIEDDRFEDGDITLVRELADSALQTQTARSFGALREAVPGTTDPRRQIAFEDALVVSRWKAWWSRVPDRDTTLAHGAAAAASALATEARMLEQARGAQLVVAARWQIETRAITPLAHAAHADADDIVQIVRSNGQLYALPGPIPLRVTDRLPPRLSPPDAIAPWQGTPALAALRVGDRLAMPPALLDRIRAEQPDWYDELLEHPEWHDWLFVDGDVVERLRAAP